MPKKKVKQYYEKWEYRLWLSDISVTGCSESTRGIWVDWLSAMMEGQTYFLTGTVDDLARIGRTTPEKAALAIQDLVTNNTATVLVDEKNVTHFVTHFVTALSRTNNARVTLINRKREKVYKSKQNNKLRQQRYRERHECNAPKDGHRIENIDNVTKVTYNREASASPITPAKVVEIPDDLPPKSDPRKAHPAIVVMHEVAGIYPPKEIWDDIIDRLGLDIDAIKMRQVFIKWRARGFNKTNYDGIIDWYLNGIPPVKGVSGNGTNQKHRAISEREKSAQRGANAIALIDELRRQGELEKQAVSSGSDGDRPPYPLALKPAESH